MYFFEATNFDQKNRAKNHPPDPPATTTYGRSKSIPCPPSLKLPPPVPDGDDATEARASAFRNYLLLTTHYLLPERARNGKRGELVAVGCA